MKLNMNIYFVLIASWIILQCSRLYWTRDYIIYCRTLITDDDNLPYSNSHPTITLNDVKENNDKSSTLVPLPSLVNLLSNQAKRKSRGRDVTLKLEEHEAICILISKLVPITVKINNSHTSILKVTVCLSRNSAWLYWLLVTDSHRSQSAPVLQRKYFLIVAV